MKPISWQEARPRVNEHAERMEQKRREEASACANPPRWLLMLSGILGGLGWSALWFLIGLAYQAAKGN